MTASGRVLLADESRPVPSGYGHRVMSIRANGGTERSLLRNSDYRAVFEASPDAMLVVDAEGVIRDLNPQALAVFGWTCGEMEGFQVEMLVPSASRGLYEQHRLRYGEAPSPRPMCGDSICGACARTAPCRW